MDPPLMLPLDEIANITAAWEGLVQLMADGGGVGITAMPVYQSNAQSRNEWGREAGEALFDAATVKIQLGGASNTQDLEVLQKLAGPRKVTRASKSTQSDGSSVSEQTQDTNVLEISDLRRLPFGWSLLFYRNRRPMLVQMRPYWRTGRRSTRRRSSMRRRCVTRRRRPSGRLRRRGRGRTVSLSRARSRRPGRSCRIGRGLGTSPTSLSSSDRGDGSWAGGV